MSTNNASLYSIGQGEAQVADFSGIANGFQQLLAKKQAQRQQELKQLTDQQAQLKPEGLRNDADRKEYFNGVNDWRNLSIQAQNEKDPYKKSLLKSQADQRYLQLNSLVGQSKQAAQNEQNFSGQLLNPTVRDRYTPDVVNKFMNNKNLSVNDPNYVKDFNAYEQIADHDKTLKNLDVVDKGLLNQTKWATPVMTKTKINGQDATLVQNQRKVDDAERAQKYDMMYQVDHNFRKTLQDIYPEIYNNHDLNPDQQKTAAIQQLITHRGPVSESHTPDIKQAPADKEFSALQQWNLKHYGNPNGLAAFNQLQGSQPTPAQVLIGGNPTNGVKGMLQGDPDAMRRIINLAPKAQYGNGKIPEPIVDPQTGEHVFKFPAQVVPDKKAIEANRVLKERYVKSPETTGGFAGFGTKPVPFEQSKSATKLKPEYTEKKPAQEYRLNPADPNGYFGTAAQMAKDQNISLPQLNQIQGGKGGHGLIPQATDKVNPVNKHKKAAKDYDL